MCVSPSIFPSPLCSLLSAAVLLIFHRSRSSLSIFSVLCTNSSSYKYSICPHTRLSQYTMLPGLSIQAETRVYTRCRRDLSWHANPRARLISESRPLLPLCPQTRRVWPWSVLGRVEISLPYNIVHTIFKCRVTLSQRKKNFSTDADCEWDSRKAVR